MGEVAPNIRYGETPEATEQALTAMAGIDYHAPEEALQGVALQSLRCGIESALINCGAMAFPYGLPAKGGHFETAYTVPVMGFEKIRDFYQEQGLARFRAIKLKVSRQGGAEALRELERIHSGTVWLDANEAFESAAEFLDAFPDLDQHKVELVEQPFRKENVQAYADLKGRLPCLLVGDESLGSPEDVTRYGHLFDVINIKIQKAGGLIPALECLGAARACGLKVMIGCMVETSLGIRESLKLAPLSDFIDLDSFLYLREEPYGLVREEDGILLT